MSSGTALAARALTMLALLAALPAWGGGVAIVNTIVSDNGDGDGFADTRETVSLRLNVKNTSGMALSDVTLRLWPRPPALVCLTVPEITVGSLAVGESRLTDPFIFTVLDVDRGGSGLTALDDLSIGFDVAATSEPVTQLVSAEITLDLDLDVSGGSGPMTFFESFEGMDLGQFEVDNIDAGKFGLEASDGYRCQYNDPDFPNSNTYGNGYADVCYMGASALHTDKTYWGLSGPGISPLGGRAFSGFHSLFYGLDLGPPENWTTPLGNLEAVRSVLPIHLGWNGVLPELAIKHQVSLFDHRCSPGSLAPGTAYDRAVVMAQLADDAGNPVGPWFKLTAHQNSYEVVNSPFIYNCTFDPTDDGNTEDDFFAPSDPERRYGPSSTCFPGFSYSNSGETSSPFSVTGLGQADGPGLAGQWGIGTWIESRFDLSRFRGRNLRVRFVASTVKALDGFEDWDQYFPSLNPDPCDDGWWIDDVTLTGALVSAADVDTDGKDNSALPAPADDADADGHYDVCDNCAAQGNDQLDQDRDGLGDLCDPCPTELVNVDPDGDQVCSLDNCPSVANPGQENADQDAAGTACDCDDANAAVYTGSPEKNDGLDNQCPGDPGYGLKDEISGTFGFFDPANKNKLSWPAQAGAGFYQVVRGNNATFTVGCTTLPQTFQTFIVDTPLVPSGQVRFYLVRALTPKKGSWGQSSAGVETIVPCAP